MTRTALKVVAAVAIAAGGVLHYRLWHGAYRHAPVHELFLANVIVSALVTVALLVPRASRLSALGGLLVAGGSLAAFALSRGPGLPTLHGKWTESGLESSGQTVFGVKAALAVLVVEAVAVVVCLGLLLLRPHRTRGTGRRRASSGLARSRG